MHRKQWNVASVDKALAAQIADTYQVDAFAALLLSSRGITEEAQIRAFLDDAPALCDPFSICDMDKAVQPYTVIEKAMQKAVRKLLTQA